MLRELSIRKCNIEMIEDDAFSNLKQLVSLDLYRNLLVTLKPHYFSELINLEYLELSDNRIESIEKNVFSNLKNLRELDLSNNKLSILDRELFIGVPNSEIFLDGNNSDFDYLFDDLNVNDQTSRNDLVDQQQKLFHAYSLTCNKINELSAELIIEIQNRDRLRKEFEELNRQ